MNIYIIKVPCRESLVVDATQPIVTKKKCIETNIHNLNTNQVLEITDVNFNTKYQCKKNHFDKNYFN